jgi:hypothetical protein
MPWSEWQDPIPLNVGWQVTAFIHTDFDQNDGIAPHVQLTGAAGTPFLDDRQMIWEAALTESGPELAQGVSGIGTQFGLPAGWDDDRDWFPDLLGGLTEGVDFGPRPDRTESDPDLYVQYQDGPNVATSTTLSTPRFKVVNSVSTFGSQPFSVGFTPNTSHFAGETGSWPGVGTVFGSGDAELGAEEDFQDEFPTGSIYPATGVTSFTIAAQLTGSEPPATNPAGEFAAVDLKTPRPLLNFVTPQWRYWIPDTLLPLRIRQRGDGLSIETTRLRNRASRQTTNRLRGFD